MWPGDNPMLAETVSSERRAGPVPSAVRTRDQLIDSIKAKERISNNSQLSAGLDLQEAQGRLREFRMTWPAFYGECGLKRSRAYVLLAIAEGRTTDEAEQAKGRERAARHAAKNKTARESVSNGQSPSPDPRLKQRNIVTLAMRDLDLPKTTLLANYAIKLRGASLN